LFGKKRQGGIVIQIEPAGLFTQDAAMPVIRVLAEAFIGDQKNLILEGFAQRAQSLLDDAVFLQRAGAGRVLMARNTEQDEGPQSKGDGAGHLVHQAVGA
jgi:hypothetical protein